MLVFADGSALLSQPDGTFRKRELTGSRGEGKRLDVVLRGENDLLGLAFADDGSRMLVGGRADALEVFQQLPNDIERIAISSEGTAFLSGSHLHRLWTVAPGERQAVLVSAGIPANLAADLRSRPSGPYLKCSGVLCVVGETLLVRGSPPFAWEGALPIPAHSTPPNRNEESGEDRIAMLNLSCATTSEHATEGEEKYREPPSTLTIERGPESTRGYQYRGYPAGSLQMVEGAGKLSADSSEAHLLAVFPHGALAWEGRKWWWLPQQGQGAKLDVSHYNSHILAKYVDAAGALLMLDGDSSRAGALTLRRIQPDSSVEILGEVASEPKRVMLGQRGQQPVVVTQRAHDLLLTAPGKAPSIAATPRSIEPCKGQAPYDLSFDAPVIVTLDWSGERKYVFGRVNIAPGGGACISEIRDDGIRSEGDHRLLLQPASNGRMDGWLIHEQNRRVSCVIQR
jgi:hypothetical protein